MTTNEAQNENTSEHFSNRRAKNDRRLKSRREGFDRRMPERRFEADEYIFKEGETAKLCYQIVSGTVGIYKRLHGETTEIIEFHEGDIFGEMALIDHSARRASAKAKTPTVVKQIHQRAFLDYLSQSPEMSLSIMKRLIAYARTSMDSNETDSITQAIDTEMDLSERDMHHSFMRLLKHSNSDARHIIENFQRPAYSAQLKQTPRAVRLGFLSIVLALLIILTSTSLIKVKHTIPAMGSITASLPLQSEFANEAMILEQIFVDEREAVRKGEILALARTIPGPTASISNKPLTEDERPSKMVEIIASTHGMVSEISKLTPQTRIERGALLYRIMPTGVPMQLKLLVPAEEAKHVKPGAIVKAYTEQSMSNGTAPLTAHVIELIPVYQTQFYQGKMTNFVPVIAQLHSGQNTPASPLLALHHGLEVNAQVIAYEESVLQWALKNAKTFLTK